MKTKNISTVIRFIIIIVVALSLYLLFLPAVNWRSRGIYWYIFLLSDLGIGLFLKNLCFRLKIFKRFRRFHILYIVIIVEVLFIIFNSPIVNAKKLQKVPEIEEGNFEEDFLDISENPADAFILDLDSAKRLGDTVVASIPNASWYEVSNDFQLYTFNGNKYRMAPLKYAGFFQFNKAKAEGIPGYVLVENETMKPNFIKTELPIRYAPSAYFEFDLHRHLQFQYPSYTFTSESYFEIYDGKTYWVTGVTEHNVALYSGRTIKKIAVTDSYSGETEIYSLDEIPEWIQHVYGLEYLMNQARCYYSYVHGFWNACFSQTDVRRTSYSYRTKKDDENDNTANFYGYNSLINKNGDKLFITGITPANKSESNIGFITLNSRTGELIFYSAEGAEESRAQETCESEYKALQYHATFPVYANVGNQSTFMMALKDTAGIIQAYGFVNREQYNIKYVDKDIDVALSEYRKMVGLDEKNITVVESESEVTTTGIIDEIYSQSINGTTYYYYVIDKSIYKASAEVNELQFLFSIGDEVTINYQETDNYRIVISIDVK